MAFIRISDIFRYTAFQVNLLQISSFIDLPAFAYA